ncbi:MAG: hypothetical protein AAFR98_04140 [Pseudomonadota bacterium]
MKRSLKKLHKDMSGSASVEFVIIAAFYAFTVTTLFTMMDVYLAANKGQKANAIVSNVASRLNQMDATRFDELVTVYNNTANSNSDDSWLRLTEVWNNGGSFEVRWSVSTAGITDCLSDDDPEIDFYIPNVASGDAVLLLETSREYVPAFGNTAFGAMTLNQRSVFVPRFTGQMVFPGFELEEDCNFPELTETTPDPGSTLESDAETPNEELSAGDSGSSEGT